MVSKSISIAICTDENYALCGAITLFSAACNLNHDYKIEAFVVDAGVTAKTQKRFNHVLSGSNIDLHWIKANLEEIKNLPVSPWVSIAGNARLLLPKLLPGHVQRVIYLDSDMLVTGDISELWDIPMEKSTVLACIDAKYPVAGKCHSADILKKNGMPANAPYFNSGMMLMDLEKWEENNIRDKVISLLNHIGEQFSHRNQDPLNIVLYQKWKIINPTWNVITSFYLSDNENELEVGKQANIIHFTGHPPISPMFSHPKKGLFYHYVAKSGWFSITERLGWRSGLYIRRLYTRLLGLKYRLGINFHIQSTVQRFLSKKNS